MRPRLVLFLFSAVLVFTMAACDSSVDLLSEDGRDLFALHGFVNNEADTQYVRVESLRPLVAGAAQGMDGVTVRSVRLDTGEDMTWEYAPDVNSTGQPAHVFRAAFRAVAGAVYQIDVQRNGVPGASASARVPPPARLEVSTPGLGDENFVTQLVTVSEVAGSPLGVRLVYFLKKPGSDEIRRLEVDYGRPSSSQGRFLVMAYPSRDRSTLMFRLGLAPETEGVALVGISLEYEVLSPEWTSQEQDPGMSLGHGFFAARGVHESSWRLDSEAVRLLGFVDAQPPG